MNFDLDLVAIDERCEEFRFDVDGRETDPLFGQQPMITDPATDGEKFFERDMQVMKDVRVVGSGEIRWGAARGCNDE